MVPSFTPDYVQESIGYQLDATAITLIVLQIVFVALRTWSRSYQQSGFMCADVFIVLALICNLNICTLSIGNSRAEMGQTSHANCIIAAVHSAGAGRHIDAVLATDPEILPRFFRILYYAIPVFYVLAVAFPKLAVLDLYLHIFVDRRARLVTYITAIIITLACAVNIPVVITQCRPVAYLWDPSIEGGRCHNIQKHFFYESIPNICTALVMLALPIPMVLRLHAPRRIKVGIATVFLTGSMYVHVCSSQILH